MADDLQKQREELEKLRREYQNFTKKPAPLFNTDNIENTKAAIEAMNDALEEAKDRAADLSSGFIGIDAQIKAIVEELKKGNDASTLASKAYKGIQSITEKLKYDQTGISQLSQKQLEKEQERFKQLQLEASEQSAKLAREKGITDLLSTNLENKKDLTEQEYAILKAAQEGFKEFKDIDDLLTKRIQKEKRINELMGLSGGLLTTVKGILGPLASSLRLDEVEENMRKVAERVEATNEKFGKLKVFAEGVKGTIGAISTALTDPVIVIGSIVNGLGKVQTAQKEFRQQTGQNADSFRGLNMSLTTTAEYIKAAAELSKELGVNASVVFTDETVTEVAELTQNMGMASAEAANLAKFAKLSGDELSDNLKNIEGTFKNFVQTNGSAIKFGDVLKEVGTVSDAVAMSLGGNPEKIAEAAMEAKKLGLSLQQVDSIASKLLDFESSITSELEAELLIGQDINLEKARLAALNNDIATLSKEIGNNEAINKAFSTGNRIQQESVAKAMGMSREEMAKMIYQQKLQNGLSAEAAAQAADISLEEAKRLTTQEQIQKSLDKIAQAFAPILEAIASILDNSIALGAVMATLAVAYLPKIISGFASFKDNLSGGWELIQKMFGKGSPVEEAIEAAKEVSETGSTLADTGESLAEKASEKAQEAITSASDTAEQAGPSLGEKIKDTLKGISEGLRSFRSVTLADIGKFAASALGFIAFTPAIPGLLLLQLVRGPLIKSALKGIAQGLVAFGQAARSLTEVAPYILLGEALIAGFGAALIPLTYALSLLSPLIEAFGSVFKSIFEGIAGVVTAVSEGFINIATGIASIATSLQNMDVSKLLALTAFLGAAAIAGPSAILAVGAGAIVGGVVGSLIGGGPEEDPVVKELQQVKNILQLILNREGTVTMDSTKIGTATSMSTYKVQ